jgi:hypothetical protein
MRAVFPAGDRANTVVADIACVGEPGRSSRLLRAVPLGRLLQETPVELSLGQLTPGYTEPVCAAAGTVFHYRRSSHEVAAYDAALKPVSHQLCALFADKRERLRLVTALTVHPSLPFALIVDRSPLRNEKYLVHLALWDCDEPRIIPLPFPGVNREKLYCAGFEFSPDSRWVVFRDETESAEQPAFVALPVVSDTPPFLGPPVFLGPTPSGPTTATCWTTGPTSFVATEGNALYRWVLG